MRRGILSIFVISILITACATGRPLKAQSVNYPQELPGTYTMILHDSPGGAAIFLDREDDKYTIVPPQDTNRFIKGVNGSDIAAAGSSALSLFNDISLLKVRAILDKNGKKIIGYELTPRITISETPPKEYKYILKGDKVQVEYK